MKKIILSVLAIGLSGWGAFAQKSQVITMQDLSNIRLNQSINYQLPSESKITPEVLIEIEQVPDTVYFYFTPNADCFAYIVIFAPEGTVADAAAQNNIDEATFIAAIYQQQGVGQLLQGNAALYMLSENLDEGESYEVVVLAIGTDQTTTAVFHSDPISVSSAGLSNVINETISVYPNPANDQIMFASSYKINTIEIYNILGQRVYANSVNDISTKVNVENFAAGNYLVKMYTEGGVATKNVVIK